MPADDNLFHATAEDSSPESQATNDIFQKVFAD